MNVRLACVALLLIGCKSSEDDPDPGGTTDDTGIITPTTDTDTTTDTTDTTVPEDLGCDVSSIEVANAAELRDALIAATPGTEITVLSGTYLGQFDVEVDGEDGAWICIRGPADRSAILDGDYDIDSWQGVLNLLGRHHISVENLEVRRSSTSRYGVLVGAEDYGEDGCNNIRLQNLHVHEVGEEIIKIQGLNTHDVWVKDCIVHSNQDWSGIDVQGTWGGTPDPAQRPRRILIRHNLIYDIPGFAGVGNEIADAVQVLDNVILGSAMGLDIGCGNYNVMSNNLITSYDRYNAYHGDPNYDDIDLSDWPTFDAGEISGFNDPSCLDGIALSGNYMSLVADNEITDCTRNGDLFLSYDHWIDGEMHNDQGHVLNLFYRNRTHDNIAYYTLREYDKQDGGISHEQVYLHNLFANNDSGRGILFEHSEDLLFINNTLANGDEVELLEQSVDAVFSNNLMFESGYSISGDSTGADTSTNYETSDSSVFVGPGDYHLGAAGSACVDTGTDWSGELSTRIQAYDAIYAAEFQWHPYAVTLDPELDLDGVGQDAQWDIGAYLQP